MEPVALFDKSFLQSLTLDESVWFDHFFYPVVCPLFFVETLADLTKTAGSTGRTPEQEVQIVADKTPVLSGAPCIHHSELCLGSLMGRPVPMSGRIPMAGGRPVQASDGKRGVVFEASPEADAFARWQREEFKEVERRVASRWRQMLSTLDLPKTAEGMRRLGINAKNCRSVDDAYEVAAALVHSRTEPLEQMALLFSFVNVPPSLHRVVLERWSIDQFRPLAEYAPYAAHVLTVELFFQIALAANLISAGRPSNRVDVAYLFYLPFCDVFVSGDKLHRKCTGVFLRKDQDFIWGPELKSDLARLNSAFAALPESERDLGLVRFAPVPIGQPDDLLLKLWDRHTPGWRRREERAEKLTPEAEKHLVERLKSYAKAPTASDVQDVPFDDLDQVTLERRVPKRKGSWWLLPKDLNPSDEAE